MKRKKRQTRHAPGEILARLTVRMPDSLAERLRRIATAQGMTLNNWMLVQLRRTDENATDRRTDLT